MTETTLENPYFDLVTTGIGYLNRARIVRPQQGAPYTCVSIAALRGRSDNPQYSYFDCRVVGADAKAFIETYTDGINDHNTKVMVRFNVGDGEATSYVLKGAEPEQRRHQIKARLLKITWAKVGDEVIDLGSEDESATAQPAGVYSQEPQTDDANPRSWRDSIGAVVEVAEDDPYYDRKTAYLEAQGYQWHDDEQAWCKAA